jgi:hypothetical protein
MGRRFAREISRGQPFEAEFLFGNMGFGNMGNMGFGNMGMVRQERNLDWRLDWLRQGLAKVPRRERRASFTGPDRATQIGPAQRAETVPK